MGMFSVFLENLICFTPFFLCFQRRTHFAVRFFPLSALAGWLLYLISEPLNQTQPLMFVYFLVEFGTLLLLFHFCFQTSWEQALFSASAGRAAQHLIYSALNLVGLKTGSQFAGLSPGIVQDLLASLLYLPFCLLIYFCFVWRKDIFFSEKNGFRREMNFLSIIILFVCIGITRFAKSGAVWDENTYIANNLYAITCCFLCLVIQSEICKRVKLIKEMETVRMLWKADSKRLAERKDTIELINMKCHDIRHRLEDYRLPLSRDEENEIESLIHIYDQQYHTGNQTLDVLLTDRALLCEKDHIQLSFMGDGACLHFLTETEVYSLFGNALGNAVEASYALEEEKRQISVIIRRSGELISINVTNYYQGELRFEEGLPVTTCSDSLDLHGYGMKSMRAIAKKYGGEMTVKVEDGVFVLTIWLVNNGARRQPQPIY